MTWEEIRKLRQKCLTDPVATRTGEEAAAFACSDMLKLYTNTNTLDQILTKLAAEESRQSKES